MANIRQSFATSRAAKLAWAAFLPGILLAATALAAPPGPLPFGVYDPEAYFINDAEYQAALISTHAPICASQWI
jgi:hypothetical protein